MLKAYSRLLRRIALLLTRTFSSAWVKFAILRRLLRHPSLSLFVGSIFPSNTPRPPKKTFRGPRKTSPSNNETVSFSTFHGAMASNREVNASRQERPPRLYLNVEVDPDNSSVFTSSPDDISAPEIPRVLVNGGTDAEVENNGKPPSVASSRPRTPSVEPPSPTHWPTLQASPTQVIHRRYSHSRSPSRSGSIYPTRTPTMTHSREESSPAVAPPMISTLPQPDWLQSPPPLTTLDPPRLPRPLGKPSLIPIHPAALSRGECRITIEKANNELELLPMTRNFEPARKHGGWVPVLHPEGVLYFFHESKRIFTDAHIYDKKIFQRLESLLETIEDFLHYIGHHENLIGQCDLVLDLVHKDFDKWDKEKGTYDGDYDCTYYFVDHQTRAIFWLDPFSATNFETGVKGVSCKTHLRHEMEAQYWYHCRLFPSSIKVSRFGIQELRDIILHNLADTLTRSHSSTSPFGHEELNRALKWVNSLERNMSDSPTLGSISLLSQLMFCFTRERFYHFYGQPAVRLARDLSVHGDVDRHTLLIRILSPLLLSAPSHHLKSLRKIWVDQLMHVPAWKAASRKLTHQWRDFILYATVTLNANVAFLSIQSIDTVSPPFRHPAQIACYISIVFCVGSIVTGLLLLKANRTEFNVQYLYEKRHSLSAVETLAVLHSLPYAFLTWAMLSFLVAFCCMCFIGTSVINRTLVGAAFGLTCLLFVWCIKRVSGMETQRQESYKSLFSAALEKLHPRPSCDSQKVQPPIATKEAGNVV